MSNGTPFVAFEREVTQNEPARAWCRHDLWTENESAKIASKFAAVLPPLLSKIQFSRNHFLEEQPFTSKLGG